MLCFVLSREHESITVPVTIRAKMLVKSELQGPLAIIISCILVRKHHIVSISHIFLIGVIDLAGLFVP